MRSQARQNLSLAQGILHKAKGWLPQDRFTVFRELFQRRNNETGGSRFAWNEYAWALGLVVASTLLNLLLHRLIGYETIALIYLLTVVWIALSVGRGPIAFGTALIMIGWSLFAPPHFSLGIAGFYDKMMFATYFVVALAVGELTTRLRAQRLVERGREVRASALYELTRELAGGTDQADIIAKAVRHLGTVFNAEVALWLPNAEGRMTLCNASTGKPHDSELTSVDWVFEHNQVAGAGAAMSPKSEWLLVPLGDGEKPEGVVGLRMKDASEISFQVRSLLESFAEQIARVLDHQRLRDVQVSNKLLTESERLGRTLLNSVSHELRTPISVITNASDGLRSSGPLNPMQQKLASEMESAGVRLNRVVHSLLNATRLQSGHLRPKPDWCYVSDLIRAALRGVEDLTAGHPVNVSATSGMPLIKMDFVLMEQALANLVANAAKHTPDGTPIEVRAYIEQSDLVLEVADRGPGLPTDQLDRIFDMFHRAPNAKRGGTGLGLTIVKGFVAAHGGRVQAANLYEGGAVFTIRLPAVDQPELPEGIL